MAKKASNPGHNGTGQGRGHTEHGNGNGYGHTKHHVPDYLDNHITVLDTSGNTVGQYTTFADALANAGDGATLQVGKGIYNERISLDQRVTIVAEEGAVLDGRGTTSNGTSATITLYNGASGSSFQGLDIIAVEGGSAVENPYNQVVTNLNFDEITFDSGNNTFGSTVYLNPGAANINIEDSQFRGELLTDSPFLGVQGDNVTIARNDFGAHPDTYEEVEIFYGNDGTYADVVLVGNRGLSQGDVEYNEF